MLPQLGILKLCRNKVVALPLCHLPHTSPFTPQTERQPDRSAEAEACETEGCRWAVGYPVSPLCCGHAPSWCACLLVPSEHVGVE